MQHNRKMRYTSAFLILGIATLVLVILNVCIGTVEIPFRDILTSIGGYSVENERILWNIRMPRTLAALLLGGALGLAGYLLQTFFHNPIAGPFVLGISSGAKMVVALVMVFLMGNAIRVSSAALIAAAFVGAMLSMGFVLAVSRKVHHMAMLVVSGVMIGYICSAITELVVTFASDERKLLRNDVGQCSGHYRCGVCHISFGIFARKATRRVPARRSVCAEYGREYTAFSSAACNLIEYFIRVYRGICGSDLLCRSGGAASGQGAVSDNKADPYDTCLLSGRKCVLSVL